MNRFTLLATALVIGWFVGLWLATALQAANSHSTGIRAPFAMTASMPIETILIIQDAQLVRREHARMGAR